MAKSYFIDKNNILDDCGNISSPIIMFLSRTENETPTLMNLHTHDFIEIFYILDGEGLFITPEKQFPIKSNDLIVVDPGQLHTERSLGLNNRLCHLTLALDNVNVSSSSSGNALLAQSSPKYFLHSFPDADNLLHLRFCEMLNEFLDKKVGYQIKTEAMASEIIVEILRILQYRKPARTPAIPTVLKARAYLDEHYTEDISLDALSEIVFLSKFHLSREFKKAYGCSPMQYLTQVRIQNGKSALRRTTKSISEIARDVGYNNPVYFSKIFREVVGVTPHKYRTTYEYISEKKME